MRGMHVLGFDEECTPREDVDCIDPSLVRLHKP